MLRLSTLLLQSQLLYAVFHPTQLLAVFGHELLNVELIVGLNVGEHAQLRLRLVCEILQALDLASIGARYRVVLAIEVGVDVGLELVELVKLQIVLALVVLDLLHQIGLDLKLLCTQLLLKDGYLL